MHSNLWRGRLCWYGGIRQKPQKYLAEFLELPNGIPDSDTFRRASYKLNPSALSSCLTNWLSMERQKRCVIAVDGKTICGSSWTAWSHRCGKSGSDGRYNELPEKDRRENNRGEGRLYDRIKTEPASLAPGCYFPWRCLKVKKGQFPAEPECPSENCPALKRVPSCILITVWYNLRNKGESDGPCKNTVASGRGGQKGMQGSVRMLRNLGHPDEEIKAMLMKEYDLSAEEAEIYFR